MKHGRAWHVPSTREAIARVAQEAKRLLRIDVILPDAMVCAVCHDWVEGEWIWWEHYKQNSTPDTVRDRRYRYTCSDGQYYFFICRRCRQSEGRECWRCYTMLLIQIGGIHQRVEDLKSPIDLRTLCLINRASEEKYFE